MFYYEQSLKLLAKGAVVETGTEIREGDVFVCAWGYIDRIVDFYRVVHRTPRTVTLEKLKNKVVEELYRDGPAGANLVVPDDEADDRNSEDGIIRKKIQDDGSLRIKSYAWAHRWDGEPVKEVFGYY